MGKQIDMIDQMYEKENRELLVAKNIERTYRNLSYVRDIIAATSLRYKDKGAFSVNKQLASASELIHYTIFHLCTFLYYEAKHLKEYRSETPMTMLDSVEARINAGNIPGRPLDELYEVWINATTSCNIVIKHALKNLQNDKSMDALAYYYKSVKDITKLLERAILIRSKQKRNALQGNRW